MKNQLDLIVTVASLILAAVAVVVFMQIRRQVPKPGAVTPVNLSPLVMPNPDIKYANSLPSGSNQPGGGGGGGMGMNMGRAGGGGGGGARRGKGGASAGGG